MNCEIEGCTNTPIRYDLCREHSAWDATNDRINEVALDTLLAAKRAAQHRLYTQAQLDDATRKAAADEREAIMAHLTSELRAHLADIRSRAKGGTT